MRPLDEARPISKRTLILLIGIAPVEARAEVFVIEASRV